ncbi:hypothetical protein [Pararhodobacter sp.]|uniref:hypothetical protein n=1 Tax=Pararhodobacter sp. TaxID=2127056 RepID=UPI002AFE522A|nr:hypothetical protein [Pararhodobacter sp.]
MKLLLIGDSHIGALKRGHDHLVAQNETDPAVSLTILPLANGANLSQPFWEPAEGYARIIDEEVRDRMDRVPPEGLSFDAIGFSMALWHGRVMRRMVGGNHCLPGMRSGRPISRAVFRKMVEADHAHILGLLDHFHAQGQPVFSIAPPAVFRDSQAIGRIGAERVLGIFQAFQEIMRAELAKRVAPVIDFPPECLDDEGYMRALYKHPDPMDPHHANEAFGVLMIRRIEAWARAFADEQAARA